MTTLKLVAPIVGAQFRPPAALLLRVLSMGHPLLLEGEPSNEHDPDAIKVLLPILSLDPDNEAIANILQASHLSNQEAIDNWVNKKYFHLGYVAKSTNSRSCQIDNRPSPGNNEIINALIHSGAVPRGKLLVWDCPATLTFSMSGQPLIQIEIP